MNFAGFIFVAIGVFAILGAAFDWEWFMNHRKARFFTSVFGRGGARIFYVILGIGLIILGVLFAGGVIQDSR